MSKKKKKKDKVDKEVQNMPSFNSGSVGKGKQLRSESNKVVNPEVGKLIIDNPARICEVCDEPTFRGFMYNDLTIYLCAKHEGIEFHKEAIKSVNKIIGV